MSTPLHQRTATELARAIAAEETTAEAIVRDCLERIEAREDTVGAWQTLAGEAAIAAAQALDSGPNRGLLHGVPVGVKDITDTVDLPTTYGSAIYADHRPGWDAACVALVKAAGGIVMGKTVTTEFAYFQPGKTANPHNPAHTPGGSSSGSAAAVGDSMVPLAFGSQTAGSVIRPASYCGVIGFKPTQGWHSLAGVKALAHSLDTLGWFARSVDDIALMRAVQLGETVAPDPTIPAAPRVGLCRTHDWGEAEPATIATVEGAAKALGDAGASIVDVPLPAAFAQLRMAHELLMDYEVVRDLAHEWRAHGGVLSDTLRQHIEAGAATREVDYLAAAALGRSCRAELRQVFGDCDVLLAPSAPGEAPAGLAATGLPTFNRMWTFLHTPALNLPGATGPNGLPVGVQVVGLPGADAALLRAGRWIEGRLR